MSGFLSAMASLRKRACCVVLFAAWTPASLSALDIAGLNQTAPEGARIVDVIERLRDHGIKVVYSQALLPRGLRVRTVPDANSPKQLLNFILSPHGLRIQEVGDLLVVARATPLMQVAAEALFEVRSSATNESITRARLVASPNHEIERLGNGTFRLTGTKAGETVLTVAAPGYSRLEAVLTLEERPTNVSTLLLAPERPGLPEVSVSASRYEILREVLGSPFVVDQRAIQHLPDVGDDPIRAVHRLPGAAANGVSAKVHVRGGEEDDTAIVLNGQTLFDPFHIRDYQNLFSAIDVRAIDGVQVYTGGFPVTYGHRMGGLILVDTLDVENPRHTELGVSVFNTSALSAGQVANGEASWLVTARRSNLDLVLDESLGRPRYTDFFGELGFKPTRGTEISVNALVANDDVLVVTESDPEEREASQSDTRNRQFWVSWNQNWRRNLSSATTVSVSAFRSQRRASVNDPEKQIAAVDDERDMQVAGIRQDWTWRVSPQHSLALGWEAQHLEGEYRYRGSVDYFSFFQSLPVPDAIRRNLDQQAKGDAYGAFLLSQWRMNQALALELGVRWDKQGYVDLSNSSQVSPRLSVLLSPSARTDFRFSWGRYYQPQGIQEIQIEDGVTEFFPAQRSDHLIFGAEHRPTESLSLRAEIYRKNLTSLKPRFENLFDPLALIPELAPDRIRVAPTGARSEGIEVSIGYQPATGLSAWASFALARVEDRIDGRRVARSWDQRHSAQAGLGWSNGRWDLGIAGSFHSGWPSTAIGLDPTAPPDDPRLQFGARNQERYASFVAFDARVSYELPLRRGTLSLFGEVSNILDRKNPCCVDFDLSETSNGTPFVDQQNDYWLPRLAAVGALWKF